MMDGWGDFFFYGFASLNDLPPLFAWRLINLDKFRKWWNGGNGGEDRIEKSNKNGSSDFYAFDTRHFDKGIEVAKGAPGV